MLRGEYIKRGLDPKNLSRTIEDAATVWEPILPWTSAGTYMASTLGVATLAYMPWAISNWIAIFFALLWAATGIGIAKLTPEEQKALEAEAERSLLRWGPPDEGSPPCCVVWARFQRGFYVSGSQPGLTSWKLPPQKPVMKTQSRGDLTDTTAWFVIDQGVMSMDSCHLLTIEASNLYLVKSVS